VLAELKKKVAPALKLGRVRALLADYQQQLADVLHETALHASLEGMRVLADKLPSLPQPADVRHVLRAYLPRLRGLAPAEIKSFAALLPPAYQEELRQLEPRLARHLPPPEPAPPAAAARRVGPAPAAAGGGPAGVPVASAPPGRPAAGARQRT